MGKIMTEDANQLRQELRSELSAHKSEQKEIIDGLAKNVEKLTEVVTEIRVYQAELNSMSGRVTSLEGDIKAISGIVSEQGKKLAIADNFVTSITRMQYTIWGALIIAALFAVFQVSK